MGRLTEDQWAEADATVTFRCFSEQWQYVVEAVCQQAGLGVSMGDEGVEAFVTITFDDTPIQDALTELGRFVDLEPKLSSGVVSFVERQASSVAVVRPGYATLEEASEVVSAVVGGSAEVVEAGGHIFVTGSNDAVERASKLNELLNESQPAQWQCSVWIVQLNTGFSREIGVDLELSGSGLVAVGTGPTEELARLILTASATAEANNKRGELLTRATLILVEGEPATLRSVRDIPVPRRTVSDQGTVSTVGFDQVEAGVIVELQGQRIPSGLRLRVTPELSQVAGFVESAPIVTRRKIDVECMVRSGDWVILGGLDDWRQSSDESGFFSQRRASANEYDNAVVVLHAVRVGPTGVPLRGSSPR